MSQYLTFKGSSNKKPYAQCAKESHFWCVRENNLLGISSVSLLLIVSDKPHCLEGQEWLPERGFAARPGDSTASLMCTFVLWLIHAQRAASKSYLFPHAIVLTTELYLNWQAFCPCSTNKHGER